MWKVVGDRVRKRWELEGSWTSFGSPLIICNWRLGSLHLLLDFHVPVSYSRTILVFVGIRYNYFRVQDDCSEPRAVSTGVL